MVIFIMVVLYVIFIVIGNLLWIVNFLKDIVSGEGDLIKCIYQIL